jgi:hypothetical protein
MIMVRLNVVVVCVLLLAIGCSQTDRLVQPPAANIVGIWQEAYTLSVVGIGTPEAPDSSIHEISLVSRITLAGQTFHISTHRIEGSNDVPGTDLYGVFSLLGDTLTFLTDAPPRAYRFRSVVEIDKLTIFELPIDMGNGMYSISLRSLPWQHSDASYHVLGTKNSGTFIRLTE